jgi:hypothetical protein
MAFLLSVATSDGWLLPWCAQHRSTTVRPTPLRFAIAPYPLTDPNSPIVILHPCSYAHPALAGVLPTPWLPLRSSDSLLAQTQSSEGDHPASPTKKKKDLSVALSLRRKVVGRLQRKKTPTSFTTAGEGGAMSTSPVQEPLNASGERIGAGSGFLDGGDNPWAREDSGDSGRRPTRAALAKRLSFDPATVSPCPALQLPSWHVL